MTDTVHASLRVPATSANLGPGFDSFGAALSLYLTVAAVDARPEKVMTTGNGAGELPSDEQNLVWRAMESYCSNAGIAVPDVSLQVDNPIPLERGLGSSSAAAVAGLAIGRAMVGGNASDTDLVALAAAFDGHPDNAAPAVLGGVVVCAGSRVVRFEPADGLSPVLCVPAVRQQTAHARGIMPSEIGVADAAANGARAALLLAGLTGNGPFGADMMVDVLHEPARFDAMPRSGALVRRLRDRGVAACLSGAGPSVLAVLPDDDAAGLIVDAAGDEFTVDRLAWDTEGAAVLAVQGSSR